MPPPAQSTAAVPPSAQAISRGRPGAATANGGSDRADAAASPRGPAKGVNGKNAAPRGGGRTPRDDDSDDDDWDASVDGELETLFFDTNQSFSDVVRSMSYPPTSSMRRSVGVSLRKPSTLLSSTRTLVDDGVALEGINEDGASGRSTSTPGAGDWGIRPGSSSNLLLRKEQQQPVPDSVREVTKGLKEAKTGVNHGQGYPGELDDRELQACLRFRQELKDRDPAYREIVYCYAPVEEESFALCRFLRAAHFDVDKVFRLFDDKGAVEVWKEARVHQFYRDFEKQYHCPFQVFKTQFPVLISGVAKNGATVNYFKMGDINIDGVECVADLPSLVPFVWHFMYEWSKVCMGREAGCNDPETTTVLAERIVIMDLNGIPSGFFTPRGKEFITGAAKVTSCFPEVLNRMYMLNVPKTFTFLWSFIKMFMEARTIKKIGFFANADKAREDLLRYVNSDELLSDYGGTGPSFYEVFATRQAEYGPYSRYVVELMTASKKGSDFSFTIRDKERIASIVVYSKADVGAAFSVMNESDSSILIKPTTVSREAAGVTKTHYSVRLTKGMSRIPPADGNFIIHAEGMASREKFLVAIGITDDTA